MWIFTRDGFFSIVENQYCRSDELMVRSRDKKDFDRLKEKLEIHVVLENKKMDYRFYCILKRTVVAAYLSAEVFEIHYPDFKDHIKNIDGDQRREIGYLNAWFSLKNAFEKKK